ncbi:cytochrome c oxidase subunit II [Bacillus taeanensis]|uniref:Cytochrome c oxidase subunit 2 n=1 Tax=Bacillus taeanensis TaxID=273032 RepID=A0A366XXF2_9BACI|nr:cytochrome c oxidase subunit II [Bacillus taeanensis]RBW70248.1 cytochrome c oxidase subunit II [Bacillus taeanensis]
MKRYWQKVLRLFPLLGLILLALAGCGEENLSAIQPKGTGAELQLDLILLSLYIMIGVILVVGVIYTYVLIKFRKRPGQENEIPEQVEGNTTLEILWTAIPILLLIILAVPTVMATFTLAAEEPKEGDDTLKVQVTANLYWWQFDYPDQEISTSQDLYIPVGEKVYIELTSNDVIHSFWVPALGGKTDTNPGLENTMWLEANEPGVYKGKCTELCGPSHALMDFKVIALEKDEFDAWTEKMKAGPEAPQTAKAQQGEEIFSQSCIGCHAVGDQGGNTAPNLTSFGDRQTLAGFKEMSKENLVSWIKNPQSMKPGNNMPAFGEQLSDEEVDALADYLLGLKVAE